MVEMSVQTVPVRALALSLIAMAGAITAAVFWPQDLLDRGLLAGGLALLPALLLAHYRGWSTVIGLLGLGVIVLCIADLCPRRVRSSTGRSWSPLWSLRTSRLRSALAGSARPGATRPRSTARNCS